MSFYLLNKLAQATKAYNFETQCLNKTGETYFAKRQIYWENVVAGLQWVMSGIGKGFRLSPELGEKWDELVSSASAGSGSGDREPRRQSGKRSVRNGKTVGR